MGTRKSLVARLRLIFPIIGQLEAYRSGWLVDDIAAGLAIAAIALPVAVAYPAIVGLPAETGLCASILALIGYALFGPSRQLIVGPDVATLTVVGASMAQLGIAAGREQVVLAASFAVLVGVLCVVSGALRLGFIANFLSRPVLTGYLCGISLSLLGSQINRFTMVDIQSPGLLRPLWELAGKADLIHIPILIFGMATFFSLRGLKRFAPAIPGALVVLAIATLLSYAFDFQSHGIPLLGKIASVLPKPALPMPADVDLDDLLLGTVAVLLVSFGSGIITARSFGAKKRYRVNPDRELIGFGAANIASGFFGGFPVTGADSRTAVNDAAGGRTQLAGVVAALALTIIVLTLTDVLQYMPIAALGAVLASAAVDLFDTEELRYLWHTSRMEFLFAFIAIVGVVGLGVLKGVLIAIGATGVYLLARVSRPSDALLGRIPGQDGFYKLHREPRAKPVPGLAVYLVQSSLLFFNADYVRDRIRWIANRLPLSTGWFVLDAQAITMLDSTAALVLEDIRADIEQRGLKLGIANLHGQPRSLLVNAGFLTKIGPEMVFNRVEDAALAFEQGRP